MLNKLKSTTIIAIVLGTLITTLTWSNAYAHGGVSIENDACILKIGPYLFHFTGYQPETSKTEEFCEDIPLPGAAIVVLEHVDMALRKMLTDFRIIKDYKGLGISARIEQLDGIDVLKEHTVFYKKPSTYPRGTINVVTSFEKGRYIGMVGVRDPSNNKEYVAIFPFSVGYRGLTKILKYIGYVVLLILGMSGVYYFIVHKHQEA